MCLRAFEKHTIKLQKNVFCSASTVTAVWKASVPMRKVEISFLFQLPGTKDYERRTSNLKLEA
jgi:hypothetical protein